MKKNLSYTVENGKIVWRTKTDKTERRVDAPCEKLRRAKEQALRVTNEIHAEEKLKLYDTGNVLPDPISENAERRKEPL
jgi:hypothetical protein